MPDLVGSSFRAIHIPVYLYTIKLTPSLAFQASSRSVSWQVHSAGRGPSQPPSLHTVHTLALTAVPTTGLAGIPFWLLAGALSWARTTSACSTALTR